MLKNLLFIGLSISFLLNFNNLSAETSVLIPLKKPTLTNEEIANKLSRNILIPIKKPKKNNYIKIEEKNITEVKKLKKDKKLSFKIPKKKPSISGNIVSRSIKISKYYNKKDFNIAKKAIAEMQKKQMDLIFKKRQKSQR
jgi:soluble lytic murein transglycosylase